MDTIGKGDRVSWMMDGRRVFGNVVETQTVTVYQVEHEDQGHRYVHHVPASKITKEVG